MRGIFLKALLCGFALGGTLFMLAPLGLGSGFIEMLRPVLAPGASLMRFVIGDSVSVLEVLAAFFLNGVIYTLLFLVLFFGRERLNKK